MDKGLVDFGVLIEHGGSNLCFKPLEPKLEANLHMVWKKHQTFFKAAEKFLERLQEEINDTRMVKAMDKDKISFAEQMKLEVSNYQALDPQFVKKERQYRDACDMRVAIALGRKITDREIESSNI